MILVSLLALITPWIYNFKMVKFPKVWWGSHPNMNWIFSIQNDELVDSSMVHEYFFGRTLKTTLSEPCSGYVLFLQESTYWLKSFWSASYHVIVVKFFVDSILCFYIHLIYTIIYLCNITIQVCYTLFFFLYFIFHLNFNKWKDLEHTG